MIDKEFFCADSALLLSANDPSAIIESLLDAHQAVEIPFAEQPIKLIRPIIMKSGMSLRVHEKTVITLKPGCGGCMLRNESVTDSRLQAAPADGHDTDISVEGGIWHGAYHEMSANDPSPVMRELSKILLGTITFSHAKNVSIRNTVFREGHSYGILLADCQDFAVQNIRFDNYFKDGIHINAPAARGLIDGVAGRCGDDIIALNAWDWDTSAISFGSITDIDVRHVHCDRNELRILPGRKTYKDGSQTECPIERCSFTDISGVYNVKMYQQPNCHNKALGKNDRSDIPGLMKDVRFDGFALQSIAGEGFAEVQLDAIFEIGADGENIMIENVRLGFTEEQFRKKGMKLAIVGPKSSTWKQGNPDPETWAELFEPDLVCTVDGMTIRNVTFAGQACKDSDLLLAEQRLSVNPDYPNTVPQGGTGYGTVKNATIG